MKEFINSTIQIKGRNGIYTFDLLYTFSGPESYTSSFESIKELGSKGLTGSDPDPKKKQKTKNL